MSNRGFFSRLFAAIWRGFDVLLKVIKVLMLVIFIAVIIAVLSAEGVRIPDSAALMIAPEGLLVEEYEGDPLERALAEAQGIGMQQTLLRDVVDSLEAAADDDRIKAVVLSLDDFQGGGLSKLQEITVALDKVRAGGKTVLAYGDNYDQNQYYLAAHADEIYLHDLGAVFIDGYAYYRTFFKSALDKLSVDMNVFRVGEFKSFVEPFLRDDMSEADKESSGRWLNALWGSYQKGVVAARELQPGALDDYANNFVDRLEAANGDMSKVALNAGLVDKVVSREEANRRVIELVGAAEDRDDAFAGVDFRTYLSAVRPSGLRSLELSNVGIVVASGEIVDGEAPAGTVGGDTLATLISQAANDDSIDAVVLRVDSPGGSMFASEIVFDKLQELKAKNKPLVVSMGSVAASGGYYIALPADEIWASESTITGSIGVGAIIPTFQRGLERLGIHVDGIGTTALAGQARLDRELGDDVRRILQATIEDAYRVFVGKVADAREISNERADSIAQGRVWIGTDALELGLVDQLGSLDQATASAAALAGLTEDDYGIKYVTKTPNFRERLALLLAVSVRDILAAAGRQMWPGDSLAARALTVFESRLGDMPALHDPRGIYFYCPCSMP